MLVFIESNNLTDWPAGVRVGNGPANLEYGFMIVLLAIVFLDTFALVAPALTGLLLIFFLFCFCLVCVLESLCLFRSRQLLNPTLQSRVRFKLMALGPLTCI
jgi:hypothetical protein